MKSREIWNNVSKKKVLLDIGIESWIYLNCIMNELQAKLARRRSLNGETEGRAQSHNELSSPNERSNSGDQTNKPILTTVKRESSTIATTSKSATDELQKKLARRRNLNGEVSNNLSHIPPPDDSNTFSGDSNPQSRTVSIERSLSTSESLQEPIADEALENAPNTGEDIQSNIKEIEEGKVEMNRENTIESQAAETLEAPESTSSNTADIQRDPKEIQDENLVIISDNDFSNDNALKMEDSAVSSEDIAFIVESVTEIQIKDVEEEQNIIPVEEVNNPPPVEPTESISISTGDLSLSEVSEVVEVALPITTSTSQPAPIETVEHDFPPTNSPSKLEGHKPISKPASIATSSKSATDELSKKLARRRDLNGEIPKDEAENTHSEFSHTSTDTVHTIPQQPPSTQPISKSASKTSLHNNSPIVPVAPPAIPQNSFLNNDDDDNEIDLPFISHKQKETLPKAKKAGKGIWDDDTILSTLEEDDSLNFTLPTNKEEVTKKLFKPKETPKPAEVVNAPAPPPVPETPPSIPTADEGNDDTADLEFDLSLPKLPKKFIESSASKSPKSAERNSKNWYPGKYIKERRLPWSQGKSPNHNNNKINSIVDQQQLFNDFVNGLAERKSSVNFDEDLGIGLSFENVEVKSLLEDFEEVDEGKDKPVLLSSSTQKRRVTMMTAPSATRANDFLNEFLRENDNLLQEIAATETSTASSTSAPSSKQVSSLPPSDETEGLDYSIPAEVIRPRSQMLQRSNSASIRVRKSNLLLENEDDEEAGGLFDDLLSPSAQRNQSNSVVFQPSSTESKGDSLLFEDEKIGKNVNVDDDLSLLLGDDSKALKYNPLEVGSQQSLIRSFANASARRSSVHDREEVAAHPTIDISSKGLLREDDDSSSDGDGEDGEGEKDQGKRSKNLFRESSQSGNNENSDGINLETKKVKKGKEVPDESITFDEFMLRLKKCSDLMEITK